MSAPGIQVLLYVPAQKRQQQSRPLFGCTPVTCTYIRLFEPQLGFPRFSCAPAAAAAVFAVTAAARAESLPSPDAAAAVDVDATVSRVTPRPRDFFTTRRGGRSPFFPADITIYIIISYNNIIIRARIIIIISLHL